MEVDDCFGFRAKVDIPKEYLYEAPACANLWVTLGSVREYEEVLSL